MPTYLMKTYGCQMNVSDSETMINLLEERGFTATEDPKTADLIMVNTCSVREKAEVTAENKIREFGSLKKKGAELWVIGCMAQRIGEALMKRQPWVTRVIGAQEIEFVHEQIDAFLAPLGDFRPNGMAHNTDFSTFLPIMRGCDNFCTYCIVPTVRGKEHSIAKEVLYAQAQKLVENGAKEITLLGQTVNSYQSGDTDFADLLVYLHDIDGLERIRFTSPHPKDFSTKVIETMAKLPKVCNHIHLPVQAGSSEVLKRMARFYTREQYLALVEKIRAAIPDIDITTDVMVGFPSETEEQFLETLSLFDEVRFTSAFMFIYSPREGTPSAKWDETLTQKEKTERLNRLIDLQTAITKEEYAKMVGSEQEVLFTARQERGDGSWIGTTYGFKRVVLTSDDDLAGKIIKVKIIRSSGMTLIAEIA